MFSFTNYIWAHSDCELLSLWKTWLFCFFLQQKDVSIQLMYDANDYVDMCTYCWHDSVNGVDRHLEMHHFVSFLHKYNPLVVQLKVTVWDSMPLVILVLQLAIIQIYNVPWRSGEKTHICLTCSMLFITCHLFSTCTLYWFSNQKSQQTGTETAAFCPCCKRIL